MALLRGGFKSSTLSVSSFSLLPFPGLCFYLMLSLAPQPPFPSIHLFYTLPCSPFPLSLSLCAQHVWWSQLYSWELNTQNCSVPWIEGRCLRNPESLSKDSVCLFNWLASTNTGAPIHTKKSARTHQTRLKNTLLFIPVQAALYVNTELCECMNNTNQRRGLTFTKTKQVKMEAEAETWSARVG